MLYPLINWQIPSYSLVVQFAPDMKPSDKTNAKPKRKLVLSSDEDGEVGINTCLHAGCAALLPLMSPPLCVLLISETALPLQSTDKVHAEPTAAEEAPAAAEPLDGDQAAETRNDSIAAASSTRQGATTEPAAVSTETMEQHAEQSDAGAAQSTEAVEPADKSGEGGSRPTPTEPTAPQPLAEQQPIGVKASDTTAAPPTVDSSTTEAAATAAQHSSKRHQDQQKPTKEMTKQHSDSKPAGAAPKKPAAAAAAAAPGKHGSSGNEPGTSVPSTSPGKQEADAPSLVPLKGEC